MPERDDFIDQRRDRWKRLEQLIERGRAGALRDLSGDEILQLGELYRLATSDLAIARRDLPNDRTVVYLNGLVQRAHPLVYQRRRLTPANFLDFVRYGYPARWRASGRYVGTAASIFVVSAVVAALLVWWRPSMADVLMPGNAEQMRGYLQQHQLWMQATTSNRPWAANFIMINNIQVALIAFAGGILVGVPTLYVIVQNGIALGATGALVAEYGLSAPFWSFVWPHGVIELSVIITAAGAGLMIGDAILRPGLPPRRDAVPAAARRSIELIYGCVPLLVVAGLFEAFVSPSSLPAWVKLMVAMLNAIWLYVYLLLPRSGPDRGREPKGAAWEPLIAPTVP